MSDTDSRQALLYFWGLGDLHFRAIPAWHEFHSQRLAVMFEDLHMLWRQEGRPAFCVSPGDLVETCAPEDYAIAKETLQAQLGDLPLYPGIGNHEYYGLRGEDPAQMGATFTSVWGYPLRYSWQVGDIVCIMLDYPDPRTLENPEFVYLMPETLAFLDEALGGHARHTALVFLHCPLRDTVLDRDPVRHRDYNSLQNFFAPENSQEVRDILAQHGNVRLFVSGHTHSGWEAPGLVKTEQLGGQPVTFVNLSSPWYTGRHTGPRLSPDYRSLTYIPDDPPFMPGFAFHVYEDKIHIKVRDHLTRAWLKEWEVSL